MDNDMLSLWYLNNYRDEIRESLKSKEAQEDETFASFKIKAAVFNEKGYYEHYLNLSNFKKTAVYGGLGFGKTYVLQSILKNILCRSTKHCLYFDLKEYDGEDLPALIAKKIRFAKVSKTIIMKMVMKEEIVFLFDNYDILSEFNKDKIKRKIFLNDEFANIKYIVTSKERITDIEFCDTCYLKSFSVKNVSKRIIRSFCSDKIEFLKFKNHIEKYKLKCFLYRPINLFYLLEVIRCEKKLSFIYDLKTENDLYKKYMEVLLEDEEIIKTASYIAYYIMRRSIHKINENNLISLIAEGMRAYYFSDDIDEIFDIMKDTIFVRSELENSVYVFKDENLKMHLVNEYIVREKVKMNDIITSDAFDKYLIWKCEVDAKFTYDNLEKINKDFLRKIFLQIEDEKVDKYYPYIQLFLLNKPYDELMCRLNIIYQRFRWDENVQKLTLKFLTLLSDRSNNIEALMKNRVVKYICLNDNQQDNYKVLRKQWQRQAEVSEFIKKTYNIIMQKCYNKDESKDDIKLCGRKFK